MASGTQGVESCLFWFGEHKVFVRFQVDRDVPCHNLEMAIQSILLGRLVGQGVPFRDAYAQVKNSLKS